MLSILLNHITCETDPQQILRNIDSFVQQTPKDIDFRNAKVWVHGVNIPFYDASNENWTVEADSRFYWYPGSGFYDVNKHYPRNQYGYNADDNMCWAGSASNALLWFLNTNDDEVQYYLKKHPYIAQTLPSYKFNQVGYDPIFNYFHGSMVP
ncbi:hypothetical protein TVAG_424790 [Trichomonas vaginalis G3]|uniref:Ig protease IdeS domain-containing protein n=1 Tax=Trichomonas vaginalis (strain ATCC PRA-98 / G3) TaxID=412133 RepID=A2FX91_TRIV3|nr:cysteine proteinases family [Trichomonas vaginalis G3]EAX90478.1 hypothetical protein TVAG_424790 [Trichomonas vaginalis G3]KAI5536981.1 cysteine proteinases family [Trichomonas vaginalis G3]|eukprot:XP_001303408.1 hypothetical protein [Trichomonas vaginalis G3]